MRSIVSPLSAAARAAEQRREHPARRLGGEQDVVGNGVVLEHRRLLELAADAEFGDFGLVELGQVVPALEIDVALVGPRLAGDDVHHRRLAGAVGADDRAHLARLQHERQAAQRLVAVEGDADAVEIEQRARQLGIVGFAHCTPSSLRRSPTPAARPASRWRARRRGPSGPWAGTASPARTARRARTANIRGRRR